MSWRQRYRSPRPAEKQSLSLCLDTTPKNTIKSKKCPGGIIPDINMTYCHHDTLEGFHEPIKDCGTCESAGIRVESSFFQRFRNKCRRSRLDTHKASESCNTAQKIQEYGNPADFVYRGKVSFVPEDLKVQHKPYQQSLTGLDFISLESQADSLKPDRAIKKRPLKKRYYFKNTFRLRRTKKGTELNSAEDTIDAELEIKLSTGFTSINSRASEGTQRFLDMLQGYQPPVLFSTFSSENNNNYNDTTFELPTTDENYTPYSPSLYSDCSADSAGSGISSCPNNSSMSKILPKFIKSLDPKELEELGVLTDDPQHESWMSFLEVLEPPKKAQYPRQEIKIQDPEYLQNTWATEPLDDKYRNLRPPVKSSFVSA